MFLWLTEERPKRNLTEFALPALTMDSLSSNELASGSSLPAFRQ